ncbi:MAG: hypothetical protein QXV82_08990 [Ignisphaera sp.]
MESQLDVVTVCFKIRRSELWKMMIVMEKNGYRSRSEFIRESIRRMMDGMCIQQ